MMIPTDPKAFFTEFFPTQFANDRGRYPAEDTPGAAVFEVFGVGSWGICILNGNLVVESGKPADTALQIGVSPEDFAAIFVHRSQKEIADSGELSGDSKDAFKPLFTNAKKVAIVQSVTGSLALKLDHDGVDRKIVITPSTMEPTEPRTTIILKLEDFLAMQSGRKNTTMLFMSGSLKIKGDMAYAMKMNALLS